MAKTGRRHAIVSGVTIGTCCAFPTLSMLQDGYKACVTTFALACELQNFWNNANQHAVPDPFGMVK